MLKYSANPDKYGSHERILSLLQELPEGSSVLDVGSASGYFGERLAGKGYSVPNVANIYVRLSLLVGRFEYADRGILNETHLRFFTLNSACALVQKAALRVKQIVVTPIPLALVFPSTRE